MKAKSFKNAIKFILPHADELWHTKPDQVKSTGTSASLAGVLDSQPKAEVI